MNEGQVQQIVGVVVDVDFSGSELPSIYNALEVETKGDRLVLEVPKHRGEHVVRTVLRAARRSLIRGSRFRCLLETRCLGGS